jgi:hydroxyacylglutathione hydrolase
MIVRRWRSDRGRQRKDRRAERALALIGIDRIAGYFSERALAAIGPLAKIPQLTPQQVSRVTEGRRVTILDVCSEMEWHEEHLPGATHIHLGQLRDRMVELPKERPIVTHCHSGARSAIAASLLCGAGDNDVSNLAGGLAAWRDGASRVEVELRRADR